MPEYTGLYRGSIYDTVDPERRGRVRVLVPQVMGNSPSGWAEPTLSTKDMSNHNVGDRVWVLFEGGDINRPSYIARMEVNGGDLAPDLQEQIDSGSEVNYPTTPPASSPRVKVTGLPTSLFVETLDPVSPGTLIQYHVSTSPINTIDSSTLSATTRATVYVMTSLPDGTLLTPNTTYYVRTLAVNAAGNAPTEGEEASGQLDLSGVTSVVTSSLKAGFVLAGEILVGQILISSDEGIKIPQPNNGIIHFPLDGSEAVVTAVVNATSLSVIEVMEILGAATVAGSMTLSVGVPSPSQAPSLAFTRNTIPFDSGYIDSGYQFPNLYKDGSNFLWTEQGPTGARVWGIPEVGGTPTLLNMITGRPNEDVGGFGSDTYSADYNIIGIAKVGSTWWAAYQDKTTQIEVDNGSSTSGWSDSASITYAYPQYDSQPTKTTAIVDGAYVTTASHNMTYGTRNLTITQTKSGMSWDTRVTGHVIVDIRSTTFLNNVIHNHTTWEFSINGGAYTGYTTAITNGSPGGAAASGYTRFYIRTTQATVTSVSIRATYNMTFTAPVPPGSQFQVTQRIDSIQRSNRGSLTDVSTSNQIKLARLTGSPGSAMSWDTTFNQHNNPSAWGYMVISAAGGGAVNSDGTYLYVANRVGLYQVNSSGNYTGDSTAITPIGFPWEPGHRVVGCYYGAADWGSTRAVVLTGVKAFVVRADDSRDTSQEWVPTPGSGGLYWDGTRFYSLNPNSSQIVEYSTHSVNSTLYGAYSWYDADPLGTGGISGTHETSISPLKSASWGARYRASITGVVAPHASVTDASRHDKANIVRIYGGSTSSVTLQSTLAVGSASLGFESLTAGDAPITSNFAGSDEVPGKFESAASDADGPLIRMWGNGEWRLGLMEGSPTRRTDTRVLGRSLLPAQYGGQVLSNSTTTNLGPPWSYALPTGTSMAFIKIDCSAQPTSSNQHVMWYLQVSFDNATWTTVDEVQKHSRGLAVYDIGCVVSANVDVPVGEGTIYARLRAAVQAGGPNVTIGYLNVTFNALS